MKIDLTSEECDELLRLVENYLQETRVETRHTKNREFRTQLHEEESVLQSLQEKLKHTSAIV